VNLVPFTKTIYKLKQTFLHASLFSRLFYSFVQEFLDNRRTEFKQRFARTGTTVRLFKNSTSAGLLQLGLKQIIGIK